MFIELMPLLADRTVLITAARESDTTVRATVVPKRAKEGDNAALSTPLSIVGRPEELDRELPRTLTEYVEAHQRLSTTLAEAKSEMEAAAKAAQEEAKRKSDERRKAKSISSSSAAPAPAEAGAPANAEPTPADANLFGGTSGQPDQSQSGGKLCL
ncbi:MAG TPA: PRTRC system protein E [Terriglobia bacterium]|nr:PRTRC system protein E [Terriglobia bacterium]